MSQDLNLGDGRSPPLSYHLVPAGRFPQAGVWSWDNLLSKTVTGALGVLSRFSEGGVDPFTAIVGQAICREFKLGRTGKQLFIKILDGLQSKSAIGNVMHYGFGIDGVVCQLSASNEGGILVILCAALGECFNENLAAIVLWELTQSYKPDDAGDRTPSPSQWRALVRQCNGVLATDEFSLIAEHFMHLHPQNRLLADTLGLLGAHEHLSVHHSHRSMCSAESMAEAILAVGKVSTGQLESITITGCAVAGWLAALVDRFFNLRLSLYGPTGDIVFTNFDSSERVQIEVLYESNSSERGQDGIKVVGRVYHLSGVTQLWQHDFESSEHDFSLYGGRVPWESAFSLTFGLTFRRLIASPDFGSALGAAARFFESIAKAETGIYQNELKGWTDYFNFGSGQGFLSHATLRFPELLPLRTDMENALNLSLEGCRHVYESSADNLKKLCRCEKCSTLNGLHDRFCLLVLTGTIIFLLRTLSGVTASENLRPTRAGIESCYWQQLKICRQSVTGNISEVVDKYGQMAVLLNPSLEFKPILGVSGSRLRDTISIFTGRPPPPVKENLQSALSDAGMCVFLDILADVSCHCETLGRYTVIPGKILMAGRSYDSLEDMHEFEARRERNSPLTPTHVGSDPTNLRPTLVADYESVSLVARISIDSLKVCLLVKRRSSESIMLGPGRLTEELLRTTGLVPCTHVWSHDFAVSGEQFPEDECVRNVDLGDGKIVLEFDGSPLSKMVALSASMSSNYVILRHRECLNCCRNAASKLTSRKVALIIL
jgi:hypothetical protein